MESISTPRISSQLIDSYVGQNVMVVGKVQQLRGDTAVIDAEGQITANLNRVSFDAEVERYIGSAAILETRMRNSAYCTCIRRSRGDITHGLFMLYTCQELEQTAN